MRSAERPPQDRTIDWAKLIDTALKAPGHMGDTYNRFYTYSFLNQLYLRMQGVQEPVATYKRWQALGRQVLKGSKAKEIVRPIIIEKKDEAGEVEDRILKFKPVRCLFTVSETSGEPLPPFESPRWDKGRALDALDVTEVPFREIDGNTQGYSIGREFAINPVAKHPHKTMMHELGHIVLNHTTGNGLAEYRTHRGVMEFQAESTAYLTMNELDMLPEDTASESRAYIQHWLHRQDRPSDLAIRQVFSATDTILKAGYPAVMEAAS